MARRIRRIPPFDITEAFQDRIDRLCERLGIQDARDLLHRSLKSLEALAEVMDEGDKEVEVSSKSKSKAYLVKIMN